MFCSFLALLLRKELQDRLAGKDGRLEWADVIRDLDNLVEMEIAIGGKGQVFRGLAKGTVEDESYPILVRSFRRCGPF